MNRRAFLEKNTAVFTAPVASTLPKVAATGPTPPDGVELSNSLDDGSASAARTMAGLGAYTGPWGPVQAAHLLRRALFGPTRTEIVTAAGSSMAQVLDGLFTPTPAPAPPVRGFVFDFTNVPMGETWVTQGWNPFSEGWRTLSLRTWWMAQMVESKTLVEKMTLFWHNHFVVGLDSIGDGRYSYRYLTLLRQNALGNFKQLTKDITVEPAMLKYLNGNGSTAGAPNENYARELLELFTIGKGLVTVPGNYTNYTESDVQAAAKVLTGWQDNGTTLSGYFTAARHDTSTKQFSSAFGNRTIADQGDQEYKALIDMIFDQAETARFLCRKLYRWFVYYTIDATTEQNVIEPMAQLLIQNNYNVAPVLRALLSSEHFYDAVNLGCMIKSPIDYIASMTRQLEMQRFFPPATDPAAYYGQWSAVMNQTGAQDQSLGNPPNVAGWPAYWQAPQYSELWINATSLRVRTQHFDILTGFTGYVHLLGGAVHFLKFDPLPLVASLPATVASKSDALIAELALLLLPQPLSPKQLLYLTNALIPGLPKFEWTKEWNDYVANPTNGVIQGGVRAKLLALIREMTELAEYQLS
ncbi:DUF1800 domain-containing protein [Hymenobacter terrenus]|uniref:DUF1800 domain-containing protein n=1 Tax=Hymenobacter terrenus TaxID=1629124 RepID=UPI0009E1B4CA|nr:DUF1800 domain-containing protein [Hymenobacter terrenus]